MGTRKNSASSGFFVCTFDAWIRARSGGGGGGGVRLREGKAVARSERGGAGGGKRGLAHEDLLVEENFGAVLVADAPGLLLLRAEAGAAAGRG